MPGKDKVMQQVLGMALLWLCLALVAALLFPGIKVFIALPEITEAAS